MITGTMIRSKEVCDGDEEYAEKFYENNVMDDDEVELKIKKKKMRKIWKSISIFFNFPLYIYAKKFYASKMMGKKESVAIWVT